MRRRLVASVFVVALLSGSFVQAPTVSAGEFEVIASLQQHKVRNDDCMGWMQFVTVMGVGEREACFLHGYAVVGTVGMPQGIRLIIQDGWTGMYGLVTGVCDSGLGCQYAQETDRLIDRFYGPNGYAGLRIYDRFLEHLQPKVTLHGLEYLFDGSPANFTLQDTDGRLLHVGAFAVSSSGQWAVAEVVNKGIVRIHPETLSVSRVFAPGYQYGRGMDPRHHLAISSDGRSVVVTGFNAGLNIVTVSDECLEPLVFPLTDRPPTPGCPVFSSVQPPVALIRYYHHPLYNRDGSRLMIRASTYAGQQYVVTLRIAENVDRPQRDLLVMGDSFTSGEGETHDTYYLPHTNTQSERCHLSQRSYPYLLAQLAGWRHPLSVACSGARMVDIVGHNDYRGQNGRLDTLGDSGVSLEQRRVEAVTHAIPGRIAQADFLQEVEAQRIYLGVGGNDAGITAKVSACAGPGTCRWATPGHRQAVEREITSLLPALTGVYQQLKTNAPLADVTVTGYPLAIQPGGRCDATTALLFTKEEQRFMNASVSLLNDVIRTAAKAVDVRFAPLDMTFTGHALCEGSKTPAMNGLRYGKDVGLLSELPQLHVVGSESFHPTPFGHQLIAQELHRQLENTDNCDTSCDPPTDESRKEYWGSGAVAAVDFIRAVAMHRKGGGGIEATIPIELSIQPDSVSVTLGEQVTQEFRIQQGGDGTIVTVAVPDRLRNGGYLASIKGLTAAGDLVEVYDWIPHILPETGAMSPGGTPQAQSALVAPIDTPRQSSVGPMIRQASVLGSVDSTNTSRLNVREGGDKLDWSWWNLFSYTLVLVAMSIMAVWLLFVLLLRK